MQGLADGYFVIPYTIANYLSGMQPGLAENDPQAFRDSEQRVQERITSLLRNEGGKTVNEFHRRLGNLMWEYCGMARSEEGLKKALQDIPALREEFWSEVVIPGKGEDLNQELEKGLRVADFLEFGELMVQDALQRDESCGGHFRVEHQTEDGEAERNDEAYAYVSAWEYQGEDRAPEMHQEPLVFENVELTVRSYK
jgi:succinate dehydrogenase / fumarate reductase flavoprotein subunit